jgi:hypothetical protein
LESLHRDLSEKYYMTQQITWNFGVIREKSSRLSANFQPISANFNFEAKFHNEISKIVLKFLIWKVQPITFPKSYHSSKSIRGDRRYLRFCARKHVRLAEINFYFIFFYSTSFSANLTRFLTLNWWYLRSPWMDFDEWWHFGNAMSYTFHNEKNHRKILRISSRNLALKLKLAEISWKIGRGEMDFLE